VLVGVEPFVLVVGLLGCEQAGAVPGFDRGRVDAEAVGDLGEGEQTAGAEPVGVAAEVVVAAEAEHDPGVKGLRSPERWPAALRLAAVSASVCWSRRRSSRASVSGLVSRAFQAVGGIGRVRLRVWPPRGRTWAWIWSVFVRATSSISSLTIRLRWAVSSP
jgi:hypothetical protein